MHFKKLLLVIGLFISTSAMAQTSNECHSAYMLITINRDATASKESILAAMRMLYSRKPDVLIRDAYMKGEELFYVVMTQEEIKQKKIMLEPREIVAEKYRAIPGVNVDTCHFREEVSITGSN